MDEQNVDTLKTESSDVSDIAIVLMKKREQLLNELDSNNETIKKIQNDYSRRMDELNGITQSLEEALNHIEALLKMEGWVKPINYENISPLGSDKSKNDQYIETAYEILKSAGKPMHYKEIFEELKDRRIFIPGKNAPATLLAKISRDSRFKRIKKRGTYALLNWRIAAAKSRSRRRKKNS